MQKDCNGFFFFLECKKKERASTIIGLEKAEMMKRCQKKAQNKVGFGFARVKK